jgi:hypothetical protein
MQTCEKDNLLAQEEPDPTDEEFMALIKELLCYNEALKCQLYQIDQEVHQKNS